MHVKTIYIRLWEKQTSYCNTIWNADIQLCRMCLETMLKIMEYYMALQIDRSIEECMGAAFVSNLPQPIKILVLQGLLN